MGHFRVKLTDNAKNDFVKQCKSENKQTIKKLEQLLVKLSEHYDTGSGQPEQLKHYLQSFCSRRINQIRQND